MSIWELILGAAKLIAVSLLQWIGFFVLALPGCYAGLLLVAAGMGLSERVLRKRGMLAAPRFRHWFLLVPFLVLCPAGVVVVSDRTEFSSVLVEQAVACPLGALLSSSSVLLTCLVLRPRRRTGPRAALNTFAVRCLHTLASGILLSAPPPWRVSTSHLRRPVPPVSNGGRVSCGPFPLLSPCWAWGRGSSPRPSTSNGAQTSGP